MRGGGCGDLDYTRSVTVAAVTQPEHTASPMLPDRILLDKHPVLVCHGPVFKHGKIICILISILRAKQNTAEASSGRQATSLSTLIQSTNVNFIDFHFPDIRFVVWCLQSEENSEYVFII